MFWISKQILQLMMEDAFDDWLLRQIHWLRQDGTIALGIDWIKNVRYLYSCCFYNPSIPILRVTVNIYFQYGRMVNRLSGRTGHFLPRWRAAVKAEKRASMRRHREARPRSRALLSCSSKRLEGPAISRKCFWVRLRTLKDFFEVDYPTQKLDYSSYIVRYILFVSWMVLFSYVYEFCVR